MFLLYSWHPFSSATAPKEERQQGSEKINNEMEENHHREEANSLPGGPLSPSPGNRPTHWLVRRSCGLCALTGWVAIPITISCLYLALRSLLIPLGLSPNTQLATDILGAGLGLGTIGLISTAPLPVIVGIVVGANIDKDLARAPENENKRLRLRQGFLFGPALFFGIVGMLGYFVDVLARRMG